MSEAHEMNADLEHLLNRLQTWDETRFLSLGGEILQFNVSRDSDKYEPVRQRIRQQLQQRFDGWSDEHDRQFDSDSIFFLLSNSKGELYAAIRMVVASASGVVPVSQSDRGCDIDFSNALEYSGMWYSALSHCLALSCMITDWVDTHLGQRDVYAIFEASSGPMRRIYLRSLAMEEVTHPLIAYDGFSYKETGQPVEWQLAADRAQTRRQRCQKYMNIAGVRILDGASSSLTPVAA